jgi:hypothetical protein
MSLSKDFLDVADHLESICFSLPESQISKEDAKRVISNASSLIKTLNDITEMAESIIEYHDKRSADGTNETATRSD